MGEEASNKSRWRLWAWLGGAAVLCMGTLVLQPAVIKSFLLALACGGIAFFGDWIGRRIGKRRYSLFQLRPRITATVVTILTGVFIAGFLQAVIFTTSKNAQQAFFHFREFKAEYQNLEADYQNLQTLKAGLERRIPLLRGQAEKFKQDRDKAQKERNTAQQERDQARQERDQAERNLDREKQQVVQARSEYHQVEKQLGKLQGEIKRSQEQLKQTEAELKRTETELKRAEGELKAAKSELETTKSELETTKSELETANKELENAVEKYAESYRQDKILRKELEERQAEVANLESQRDQLLAQRDLLVSGIAAAQKEIDALQWRLRELTRAAAAGELRLQLFLERDVIYHAGELLVQAVVDGTRPVKAIRERLEELLEIASTRAALRGAARGENGRYVRAFLPVSVGGEVRLFLEERLLDNFAQFLAERKDSVVLQILAARNTVEGECVFVEFARPQPNRCIFRSGDEITKRVIDGTLPDVEIYKVLLEMLQNVGAEARQRGLIPTLPGGQFGEILHTELFPVMHRVQDARGPVTVRILADKETWTSDPLEIRFVVGEGEPQ